MQVLNGLSRGETHFPISRVLTSIEQRAENGCTDFSTLKALNQKTPESLGDTASDRFEEQIDTTTRA